MASLYNKNNKNTMKDLLLQILNSSDPSINPIYGSFSSLPSGSDLDSFLNADSIYNISRNSLNSKTYLVDKIIITSDQLSSIKLNSLSEFMRKEILQYQLGTWNKQSPSSVIINLPLGEAKCVASSNVSNCVTCNQIFKLNDITLDKLTFQFKESSIPNKVLSLKDYWPVNGADLAIKAEEGLRLRSLLGLEQDQEITILSLDKQTPQSTQTSLVSDTLSLNESELFYNSSTGSSSSLSSLISQETKPNNFTVDNYHNYINKPLPQLPILEVGREVFPRQLNISRLVYIRGDIWTHSTILEGSRYSLSIQSDLDGNNSPSSSRSTILSDSTTRSLVNNSFPQNTNTEFRSAILGMMNEIDNELSFLNNNSNITRTNTGNTTLVNSPVRANSSEEIYTSPSSMIRFSSPGTNSSSSLSNIEHNLREDID
jgi:hypothetical protein